MYGYNCNNQIFIGPMCKLILRFMVISYVYWCFFAKQNYIFQVLLYSAVILIKIWTLYNISKM